MATYHLVGLGEVRKIEQFILPACRDWLENPAMLVYCAKEENVVVGAIGVWLSQNVANIVSLSVSPAYQRQGIGLGLVECVQERFADFDCQSLQVSLSLDLEGYVPLIGLFFDADFQETTVAPNSRTCKLAEMLKHPLVKASLKHPKKEVMAVKSVPNVALQMYNASNQLEIPWREVDPEMSVVLVQKGRVEGCLIIGREGDGAVCVSWLHVSPGRGSAIVDLMAMAAKNVALKMGLSTNFSVVTVNEVGAKLVEKLIPQQGEPVPPTFTRFQWRP